MSYSFNAKGKNKLHALSNAKLEMDKVVAAQPLHALEAADAIQHASNLLKHMSEPVENVEIMISMSGSVWKKDDVMQQLAASVNISYAAATPGA